MRILALLLTIAAGTAQAGIRYAPADAQVWQAQSSASWKTMDLGAMARVAFVVGMNGKLRVAYRCFKGGRASLVLSGAALAGRKSSDPQILMLVDRQPFPLRVTRNEDGQWVAQIPPNGNLVRALRAGDFASLLEDRDTFYGRVPLKGSSNAIRSAQSFCGIS